MAQASAEASAADADYNAKVQQYNQNVINSYAAARDEQKTLQQRELQEQNATSQKIHLSNLDEAEKKAEAEVAAVGSGVSGLSVDNIIANVGRRSAYNRTIERENYRQVGAQLQVEKLATVTKAKGRIDSIPIPQPPNKSAFFIKAIGSGISAFGGL